MAPENEREGIIHIAFSRSALARISLFFRRRTWNTRMTGLVASEIPPSLHNKVAASAHFVCSREHGAGAPRRRLLNVSRDGPRVLLRIAEWRGN